MNSDKIKTMTVWALTYTATILAFFLYANSPLSDYEISNYGNPAVMIVTLLVGYQLTYFSYFSLVKGWVDTKVLVGSAILALATWHFSVWGDLQILINNLFIGEWDALNQDEKIFDKQGPIVFLLINSLVVLAGVSFKRKASDLKILTLGGFIIVALMTWYHVFFYWSFMEASNIEVAKSDEQVSELTTMDDKSFNQYCDMMADNDFECFRFNVHDGAPSELESYVIVSNAKINENIKMYKEKLESSKEFVTHSGYFREEILDDTYAPYYSKTVAYDMRNEQVTFVISNYQYSRYVALFEGLSIVVLWIMVLWFGVLGAIATAHTKVSQKNLPIKWGGVALQTIFIMFFTFIFAMVDSDLFFRSRPFIVLIMLLGYIGWSIKFKASNTNFFLGSVMLFVIASFTAYMFGISGLEESTTPNELILEASIKGFAVSIGLMLVHWGVIKLTKMNLTAPKEIVTYINALSALIIVIGGVAVGYLTMYFTTDLLTARETILVENILSSDLVTKERSLELCSMVPMDACKTIMQPTLISDFYHPIFVGMWLMLFAVILNGAYMTNLSLRRSHVK